MESPPMGLSLLFALLEPELYAVPKSAEEAAEMAKDPQRKSKFQAMEPKQKKEVREALYKALYAIVEYPDINRDLSRAIGKALSGAIRGEIEALRGDEDIKRLYDVLKPVVREAIDEV